MKLSNLFVASTLAGAMAGASAQEFPSRPLRIIVPLAAGGPVDTVSRVAAPKLSEGLGQPVVVENRPGGSTLVGTRAVLQLPPDGYTMLATTPVMATNSVAYKNPGYKLEDFRTIGPLASTSLILTVHESLPVKTLAELVAYAKANPGKINAATTGGATSATLLSGRFVEAAGISVTEVPFQGGAAPANSAMLGGVVHMIVDGMVTQLPNLKMKQARLLAIATDARSPAMPDVPTFKEQGYPSMVAKIYSALFAHGRTPEAIATRLTNEVARAGASPEVQARVRALGLELWPGRVQDFPAYVKEDLALWAKDIRRAGVVLDE